MNEAWDIASAFGYAGVLARYFDVGNSQHAHRVGAGPYIEHNRAGGQWPNAMAGQSAEKDLGREMVTDTFTRHGGRSWRHY